MPTSCLQYKTAVWVVPHVNNCPKGSYPNRKGIL